MYTFGGLPVPTALILSRRITFLFFTFFNIFVLEYVPEPFIFNRLRKKILYLFSFLRYDHFRKKKSENYIWAGIFLVSNIIELYIIGKPLEFETKNLLIAHSYISP